MNRIGGRTLKYTGKVFCKFCGIKIGEQLQDQDGNKTVIPFTNKEEYIEEPVCKLCASLKDKNPNYRFAADNSKFSHTNKHTKK